MKRPTLFLVLTTISALFPIPLAHAGPIEWTGHWKKTSGFFGPNVPFPEGVVAVKEAFGADSTVDEETTGIGTMPGIGKTVLAGQRIARLRSSKAGAVFDRPFKLTEDTNVTVTASLDGVFKATGMFVLGDFANARATAEVFAGETIKPEDLPLLGATAFDTTDRDRKEDPNSPGQFLALEAREYEASDSKMIQKALAAGVYTFRFRFDSDVVLQGGANEAKLEALLFDSFTADISANEISEPSAPSLLATGVVLLIGCSYWRTSKRSGERRTLIYSER